MTEELAPWVEPDPPDVDGLDEYLDTAGEAHPELGGWTPRTYGAAEWAMVHLARHQGTVDTIALEAQAAHERIDEWERNARRRFEQKARFFEGALVRWGLINREQTGAATHPLPSGSVTTRWVGPRLIVIDEEKVLAWLDLRGYHDAVKVERSVRLGDLKRYVTITEHQVGWRARTEAGGRVDFDVATEDDVPVAVGELISGSPIVEISPIVDARPVDQDGTEVPGLSVEPGHIRAGASCDPHPPVRR